MKKLSLYIVLVLMWSNVSFANDINKIEDIKINGISIGDNLLDHFSKLELIQNKKLLEVRSEQNQLFYSSEVKIPFFSLKAIFYYESNERVGMTEKPIYRIIGISMPVEICDAGLWDSDEIIEEVPGGAHRYPNEQAYIVREKLVKSINELMLIAGDKRRDQRNQKYLNMTSNT